MRSALLIPLAFLAIAPAQGQKLTPVDEAGYSALLKSQAGRVVLVDFWATWCGPCRKEMPFLVSLASKLRAKGFTLVTVSADEPEQEKEALQFLKTSGVPLPGYLKTARDDDRFIRAVDPQWSGAIPALFLYDKSGKKVQSFIGETPPATIEAAVRKLVL